jgi:hypothetical protein
MKTLLLVLVMLDDTEKHKEWMDEAQDLKEDLRDALQAKSRAKAAEPAARLIQFQELGADAFVVEHGFQKPVGASVEIALHDEAVAGGEHHQNGRFGGHSCAESEAS